MNYSLLPVSDVDHDWLVELHNDPKVLYNLTDPTPITLQSHMKWWETRPSSEQYCVFYVNDVKTGFVKFKIDSANKNVILGADIHQSQRGHGYAKYMWSLMLDRCFNALNAHRASLITAEYNQVAIRIYKKLGFMEEGRAVDLLYRDGKFFDAIYMYLLSTNYEPHHKI